MRVHIVVENIDARLREGSSAKLLELGAINDDQ
jgi:hypothetical protein